MSRSGYSEDGDDEYAQWGLIRWRGAVTSVIRGKRGQKFFRDLLVALDALPEKKLIADELERKDGCVCALGALGKERRIEMDQIDPDDSYTVASAFDIAEALAREVVWINDEVGPWKETPEERFERVRAWVVKQIKSTDEGASA